MTALQQTTKGCGCGAGAGYQGQCGCQRAPCGVSTASVCPPNAIARPRFFAGQLLTQEDLQLAVDYTVGKNRLHNRFLFGEGVVCGLTVTCSPCGGSQVAIAPGYALDSCGNDIFVPCREELDITALVRELRLRQFGSVDCGDPCAKQTKTADIQSDPGKTKAACAEPPTYHYCLYIRYRETPAELVAPYRTDGDCASVSCEASRVCEGYSFELRCETKPRPSDFYARLAACFGDIAEALAILQEANDGVDDAVKLRQAAAQAESKAPALSESDKAAASQAIKKLGGLKLSKEGAAKNLSEPQAVRDAITLFWRGVVALARARVSGQEEIAGMAREWGEQLGASAKAIGGALDALDKVEAAAAKEMLRVSQRFAIHEDSVGTSQAKLVRVGFFASTSRRAQLSETATKLKAFLRARLENATCMTDCKLYQRLLGVYIGEDAEFSVDGLRTATNPLFELTEILLEYLRSCVCLALTPSCPEAGDTAVLLACLDVQDCEVVDICNMSRSLVLSPAGLRYWWPSEALGRLVERVCCALSIALPEPEQDAPPPAISEIEYVAERPRSLQKRILPESTRPIAEAADVDFAGVEQILQVGAQLGALTVKGVPTIRSLEPVFGDAVTSLRAVSLLAKLATPKVQMEEQQAARASSPAEIEDVKAKVEKLTADLEETRTAMKKLQDERKPAAETKGKKS